MEPHSRTLRPLQCESHPRIKRNEIIMADEEENNAPEPVEEVEMSVLDALKEVSPSILYRLRCLLLRGDLRLPVHVSCCRFFKRL
jgi:hypothetical protein